MLHKDVWLSQYFSGGAYLYKKPYDVVDDKIDEGFVYTKLPTDNQNELNTLIRNGFDLVEILVYVEQKKTIQYQLSMDNDIGFAKKEEKNDVIAIAKNAFVKSRLYQDSRIPNSIASQIKVDWVANFFLGLRGDNLIVTRVKGRVAGFLLLINNTTIDLIAVSPDYHRKGLASSMISFANQTFGLLNAGTQLNNHMSLAMYERCGFITRHAHFVLHKFYGKV